MVFLVDAQLIKGKGKKGKDVDLYSASHVQDASNVHFVTETEPPGRFRSPPIACKHWPAQ